MMEKTDETIPSREELAVFIEEAAVSVTNNYEEAPAVLMVDDAVIGTLGNFSASIGKAKSKKTFNVSAIAASALSGRTVLRYRSMFPENKRKILYIGVSGCLKGQNTLTAILSIALGAIIGELLDLDRRMRSLGDWVQTRTARLIHTEDGAPSISDGFITASLLFCVGAMAIVGALENGLTGSYDTLKAKSIIDGISSIVFASSLGVGVAFSAGAIFLYQGAISLLAGLLSPLLGDAVIAEMTCVGSLLIVALSLNMLNVTKIKVMNLVPAIFLPILLCRIM